MAIDRIEFASHDQPQGRLFVTVTVHLEAPINEFAKCEIRFVDAKDPNETNAQEEARHLAKAKAMAAEFAQS